MKRTANIPEPIDNLINALQIETVKQMNRQGIIHAEITEAPMHPYNPEYMFERADFLRNKRPRKLTVQVEVDVTEHEFEFRYVDAPPITMDEKLDIILATLTNNERIALGEKLSGKGNA